VTRLALALCCVGWLASADPVWPQIVHWSRLVADGPWPGFLESPLLTIAAWLTGLTGLLIAAARGGGRAPLLAWWLATIVLASQRITGFDATFFGGIWVASFVLWWDHTRRSAPERLWLTPRLAVLVSAAVFFPPGVGKMVDAYATGTAFHDLHRYRGAVESLLGDSGSSVFYRWFGRVAAAVELSAIAWPLLPVRLGLGLVLCVTLGLILTWNIALASILLPLAGVALLGWSELSAPRPSDIGR